MPWTHGIAILLWLGLAISPLWAGNGSTQIIPPVPAMAKNRIQIRVDTRGVNGNGFRPVKVSVLTSNGRASAVERSIVVELTPDQNYWEPTRTFRKTITLPAGANSAEAVIPFRQSSNVNYVRVAAYEDGRRLPEINGNTDVSRNSDHTEMWPTMLFIDSRAPVRDRRDSLRLGGARNRKTHAEFVDFRALAQLSPVSPISHLGKAQELPRNSLHYGEEKPRVRDVLNALREAKKSDLLPLSELADSARDMSDFDLVFISLDDLNKLQAFPKKAEALNDWVKLGHTLYVYDAEARPMAANLKQVDQIVGGRFGGWQAGVVVDANRLEEYDVVKRGKSPSSIAFSQGKKKTYEFLKIRSCGLGRVVYISGDPYAMPYKERVAIFNIAGIKNWAWRERNGISMLRRNSVFWDNLIPGLGLPPVNTFLLVMTLFVLAVGPLSYALLRRAKRLFLILIVTPAASLLMLTGLLGFAMMSDGFGVKTQVRGITFLDRTVGRASSISHQTYYSSIGGESSLRFPSDTVMYPVRFQPQSRADRGKVAATNWDDGHTLSGSFLRPRTMTQFLVARAASSTMDLTINEESGKLSVVNGLQSPIQILFAKHEGQFYVGRDIPVSGTQVLQEIEADDLEELTQAKMAAMKPTPPLGWDENAFLRFANRGYYGSSTDRNFGMPNNATSLLERHINVLMSNPSRSLPDGGFAACVEQSRATPVGVSRPRRFQGLELVFGRWK